MVASSSEKKPKSSKVLTAQHIEQIAIETAKYVNGWALQEFKNFIFKSKIPVCLKYHDKILVGFFEISQNSGLWKVHNLLDDQVQWFQQKQSAVFYCVCYVAGRRNLSDEIKRIDYDIMKLKSDLYFYQEHLTRSMSKSDSFRIDLYQIRIIDSRIRLKHHMNHLQKKIKHAKYLKVWSPD